MSYKFYENKTCEYFPCHNLKKVNCLFCFCPLFPDWECGGSFTVITDKSGNKIKDCSDCILPHTQDGYEYIIDKLSKK